MSFLLDLIFVMIIGYAGWRGYKNGIIRGVCGILAVVVSIVIANIFATVYFGEFTGMLEPFACGVVDSSVASTLSTEEKDLEGAVVVLDDSEKTDVNSVSFAALRRIGLSEGAAEKIADETSKQVQTVGQDMSDSLTKNLCEKLSFLMIFSIIFVLAIIVFAVIGNIIDLKFSIPDAEKANMVVGVVLGLFKGIIFVLFFTCVLRYMGMLIPEEIIKKTVLTEWLMNSNLIANIIGL